MMGKLFESADIEISHRQIIISNLSWLMFDLVLWTELCCDFKSDHLDLSVFIKCFIKYFYFVLCERFP